MYFSEQRRDIASRDKKRRSSDKKRGKFINRAKKRQLTKINPLSSDTTDQNAAVSTSSQAPVLEVVASEFELLEMPSSSSDTTDQDAVVSTSSQAPVVEVVASECEHLEMPSSSSSDTTDRDAVVTEQAPVTEVAVVEPECLDEPSHILMLSNRDRELANQRRKKIEERKQIRLNRLAEREEKKRLKTENRERKQREKEEKDRIREQKREAKINRIRYFDENARQIRIRKSTKQCLPPLINTLGSLTTEDEIKQHHIGELGDIICPLCKAKRWQGEITTLCCSRGQSIHPPLTSISPVLKELFKGETQLSKHFLTNIFNFNNMFCFTSFATSGSLENASESIMTYKIKGRIYHRLGVLKPR